jgi:hypothetical protein
MHSFAKISMQSSNKAVLELIFWSKINKAGNVEKLVPVNFLVEN